MIGMFVYLSIYEINIKRKENDEFSYSKYLYRTLESQPLLPIQCIRI